MSFRFMETVCRTGIFVICAQALVHFRPNVSYEKYMKMLVSVVILLQLFLPVSSLIAGEEQEDLTARAEWFEEQMRVSLEQAMQRYSEGEKILEDMTLKEVLRRAEQSAEQDVSAPDAGQTSGSAAVQDAIPEKIAPVERIKIGGTGEGGVKIGGEEPD